MTPTEQLTTDMKDALRSKNREVLDAVRFLLAQVRNAEIDKPNRESLTTEEFTKIVRKLVKNAEEAIQQYRDGAREDLAVDEERKVVIWKKYLPQQLSEEEVEKIIDEVMQGMPSSDQIGPIIGKVMAQAQGQTDGGTISRLVKKKLSL